MAKKSRVGLDFQVWVDDLSGDILPLATYSCFNKSSSLVFQSGFLKKKKKKKEKEKFMYMYLRIRDGMFKTNI